MLDAVLVADTVEDVANVPDVLLARGELHAVTGQHGMDAVRHSLDQVTQELSCLHLSGASDQADEGELAGAVDGHEQAQLALLRADLGYVEVEVANGIGLEELLRRLVAVNLGQAGDAVPLQAPVQRRAGEVRDGRLQGVEAVIQRQQGVTPEGDDDGLLLGRERRGLRLPRASRQVGDRTPLAPLGDGLGVDAVASRQVPQARLTMLDRATDRLCRAGAPVENLAHSASFHSWEKTAPSNPGIKHLDGAPNVRRTLPATCWPRSGTTSQRLYS
jgi:hypothetical protein